VHPNGGQRYKHGLMKRKGQKRAVFYIVVSDGRVNAECINLPQEGIEGRES